jgi:hypothetical protein
MMRYDTVASPMDVNAIALCCPRLPLEPSPASTGHGCRQKTGVCRQHQDAVNGAAFLVVRILARLQQIPDTCHAVDREQGAQTSGNRQMRALLAVSRVVVEGLPDDAFEREER